MYTGITVKHTGRKVLVEEAETAIDDIEPVTEKEYCGICP